MFLGQSLIYSYAQLNNPISKSIASLVCRDLKLKRKEDCYTQVCQNRDSIIDNQLLINISTTTKPS